MDPKVNTIFYFHSVIFFMSNTMHVGFVLYLC